MNKVITINLNGRAYEIEEAGFEALSGYLDRARARLAEDPGQDEILADLEQAIAEKCDRILSPHKTVVTSEELQHIIAEMGPVGGDEPVKESRGQNVSAPKKLYRIKEGSWIFGVCTGLAAFFGVDVTLVRVIFVLLAVFTGGGFGFAYFVMMLVIPEADTLAARAAARGEALNAQELINRAKLEMEALRTRHDWHRWKQDLKRQMKAERRARVRHPNPIVGFLCGALGLLWIFALLSLVTTHALFGWAIPASVPLWVAVIALFLAYHAVIGPMKGARYVHGAYGYGEWDGVADGLTVLFLVIALVWAYAQVPEFYAFVHHPIIGIEHLAAAIRGYFAHAPTMQ